MGTRLSRAAVPQQTEPRDIIPYRYPPPDDENYFSSHFHLGYRKFEAGEPEVFLFGELSDINFLPSKPVAFPYKQPSKSQPIKCLRSFVNLQRDSVKLVKVQGSDCQYHIEFMFDSDVPCQFTIYDFLPNTVELESLRSGPYLSSRVSSTFQYPAGSEQRFSETGYTIAPGDLQEDQLSYDPENDQQKFPVAILLETNTGDGQYQSQLTICNLDKFNDSGYTIKVLKQKLLVDGVEYLLQEIYGIENKSKQQPEEGEGQEEGGAEGDNDSDDDDEEDLGAECVICITDPRDTILLPCRHLCLCNSCAANLRYQSSNCPICRAPFRALLNIQALEPLDSDVELDDDEITGNPKYSIPGYKMVPLLSALNGYQLENSENASLADPSKRRGNHEQQEEESAAEEEHSPRGQTTSRFCAIPIEDLEDEENEITTEVVPIPRSSTNHSQQKAPQSRVKQYEIDEDSIPLPGTPTSEEDDVRFRMKRTGSNSSSNQLTTSVTISIMSDGEERQEVVSLELHPQHPDPSTSDPESPYASSVSSQQSVKSTDVLLPGQTSPEQQGKGGGKKAGDSSRRAK